MDFLAELSAHWKSLRLTPTVNHHFKHVSAPKTVEAKFKVTLELSPVRAAFGNFDFFFF